MIKCIVCDLDGTLIKTDDTIEKHTFKKLKECMDKGIEFIIATGRDINMVVDFLEHYDLDCDLILNNGTQYRDKEGTFNEIYPMDNDSFIKIAHILDSYGYLLAIHTNQGKYSLHDENEFWDYHLKLLFFIKLLKIVTTKKGIKIKKWMKPYLTYTLPILILVVFLLGVF